VTLALILAATVIAGLASVLAAAWMSMPLLSGAVGRMVSLSAGMLLATALLHLVPEAIESGADVHALCATLLAGLVGFFLLEKLAVMRHSHHYEGDGHPHHHGHDRDEAGPGGTLILVGDAIHNFADGILIAAAFLADLKLGLLTTLAIAAHEIPQEIGDYAVLLHAGYSRGRALALNAVSGIAGLAGAVAIYYATGPIPHVLPYVLAFAAGCFMYIAMTDLIPGLHRGQIDRNAVRQTLLILAGLGVILVI